MNRLHAVRKHCVDCVGGSYRQAENCSAGPDAPQPCYRCTLYPFRMGKNPPAVGDRRNRCKTKLIRKYCLDCMGDSRKLVRQCPSTSCALWPFRMGAVPSTRNKANRAVFSQRPGSKGNKVITALEKDPGGSTPAQLTVSDRLTGTPARANFEEEPGSR